jgi:membrane-associated phospholipid phosphatase
MDALARTLSIFGHPVLVLPAAVWLAAAPGRAGTGKMLAGFAVFGLLVMGWSRWQVRRGRWLHVDASAQAERRALNRFLLFGLTLGTLLAWRFAAAPVAMAIGLSLLLVLAAILSARWCKLSLHVAFATYAAVLLWRIGPWAVGLGLVFAAVLAWSRLALKRHVQRDLFAGAIAGGVAGLLFWRLLGWQGVWHA